MSNYENLPPNSLFKVLQKHFNEQRSTGKSSLPDQAIYVPVDTELCPETPCLVLVDENLPYLHLGHRRMTYISFIKSLVEAQLHNQGIITRTISMGHITSAILAVISKANLTTSYEKKITYPIA